MLTDFFTLLALIVVSIYMFNSTVKNLQKGQSGFIVYKGYVQPAIFEDNTGSWINNALTGEDFLAIVKEKGASDDLHVKVVIYRGEYDD